MASLLKLGGNKSENKGQDGMEQCGGVHNGGGDGGQEDGQPGGDDGCRATPGPGGGHGLLVVTGKRRGRPKKGIVQDGWFNKIGPSGCIAVTEKKCPLLMAFFLFSPLGYFSVRRGYRRVPTFCIGF